MLSSIKMDVSQSEVASMMKLIDKNNQGYLTFTDFSKVFSPSMSTNLVSTPLTDNYRPNQQPSEEMNTFIRENQKDVAKRIDDIRAMFKPPQDPSKYSLFSNPTFRAHSRYQIRLQAGAQEHFR